MADKKPLGRTAALRTRDPAELQQRLAPLYAIRSIDVAQRRRRFNASFNHRELESVGLTYATYGSPLSARLEQGDFYAQGFGTKGYGEAVVNGRLFKVADKEGGIGGPGAAARLSYDGDFEHFILKIKPEAVTKKLSALLGAPVNPALEFSGAVNRAALEAQFRLLRFVISELERDEAAFPTLVLAELEQAMIVAFLCGNLHNYTRQLSGGHSQIAPWQVHRAADYIAANWDQPITIEALAVVTESSARSLFLSFKKALGCSPMAFVKRIRLQHARDMLLKPVHGVSVTGAALDCGFNNLGHFAKDYASAFGELPSETLKRGKLNGAG